MSDKQQIVDRSDFIALMKQALQIDPKKTAVITVDTHRGHLDPQVATMPVDAEHAHQVVSETRRLLDFARGQGIPVIHVIIQNRILPDGQVESTRNPFWQAVEGTKQKLTPDLPSTVYGHNLVGSIQTQLMPELGPDPRDIVINTKRRLSIFRDTDLDITLDELGVDTVVLAGINTNTCVQCAAFEAMNRDMKAIVVSDCVYSMYGDDLHVFGLQNVARCFGWVLTIEELKEKVLSQMRATTTL